MKLNATTVFSCTAQKVMTHRRNVSHFIVSDVLAAIFTNVWKVFEFFQQKCSFVDVRPKCLQTSHYWLMFHLFCDLFSFDIPSYSFLLHKKIWLLPFSRVETTTFVKP